MRIVEKYEARVQAVNSLVCVGLDTTVSKAKERFPTSKLPLFDFNQWVIDQTADYVSAYKPNLAFYEAVGVSGWHQLEMTMDYLKHTFPDVVTIADAKRADIDSTNEGYVASIFDHFGFDAITLHPYLGKAALSVFLQRVDKACIILCRTSNPGAGEFQDILNEEGKPLWQTVAEHVSHDWNSAGNCMLVVGATYPTEMAKIREIAPELTFLVPGIGAQGGEVEPIMKAGQNDRGTGMIINSARGVIYNENPGKAAQKLRDEINQYR